MHRTKWWPVAGRQAIRVMVLGLRRWMDPQLLVIMGGNFSEAAS